jgi:hypothetical protein
MSLSRQRPTSLLTMGGPCAWCEKEASLFEQTLRNITLINTGLRRTRRTSRIIPAARQSQLWKYNLAGSADQAQVDNGAEIGAMTT